MMFVASFELSQIKVFFHYTILVVSIAIVFVFFFLLQGLNFHKLGSFSIIQFLIITVFIIVAILLQDLNFLKLGFISIA
jgi:hypothetical protein